MEFRGQSVQTKQWEDTDGRRATDCFIFIFPANAVVYVITQKVNVSAVNIGCQSYSVAYTCVACYRRRSSETITFVRCRRQRDIPSGRRTRSPLHCKKYPYIAADILWRVFRTALWARTSLFRRDLRIQTCTEPVSLKFGKLATHPWYTDIFYSV